MGPPGIGIDERYHELVFGLFERLDAAAEGTGKGARWSRPATASAEGESSGQM